MLARLRLPLVLTASFALILAVVSFLPRAGASPSAGLVVGVNCSKNPTWDADVCKAIGTSVARIEFDIRSSPSSLDVLIGAYASRGIQVQPLAGFAGRLPTSAENANLRAWALRFGSGGTFWQGRSDGKFAVRNIEFGNETSYGYQYGDNWNAPSYATRAFNYGIRAREAAIGLQGTGVGLLVQAEDGDTGSAIWVNRMFAAAPDLDDLVAGWTLHPYGPNGYTRFDRMIAHLAGVGASTPVPFYVTEWGVASDNGRTLSDNYGYPKNLTYAQAGQVLKDTISSWKSRYGARLAQVIIYQNADLQKTGSSTDREGYFGVTRSDGALKGAYASEVLSQIASNTTTGTPTAPAPVPVVAPTPIVTPAPAAPPAGSVSTAGLAELAAGKPVDASSSENDRWATPQRANDGLTTSRWSSKFLDGEWWQVDLGGAREVRVVEVVFNSWAWPAQYTVSTSADGSNWLVAANGSLSPSSSKAQAHSFAPRSARFVRITGVRRGTDFGTSIVEARVYGSPVGPTPDTSVPDEPSAPTPSAPTALVDKAQGKPATASASENATWAVPGNGNDGNTSSRWSSPFADGQWWQVDLGSAQVVTSVSATFNKWAWPRNYTISVSADGATWTVVASNAPDSAGESTTTFDARSARFVRITGLTRATTAGISIEEARVYGPAGP